ncbi:hypothetical protein P886_1746 [Alteromonadaceae bacterium 2753L.S.0a.02]|nr:hypothetical protein P886_1746 [Alteromonadaceae bacterium 2753L.S.0a.02]
MEFGLAGLNEREITYQYGNTGPALGVAAKTPLSALPTWM